MAYRKLKLEQSDLIVEQIASRINTFARRHKREQFYAFAIDACLLCLNSESQFAERLSYYQSGRYAENYRSTADQQRLRFNTGDWMYQGFSTLPIDDGFYWDDHYGLDSDEQQRSPYRRMVNRVLAQIRKDQRAIFAPLKTTKDFRIFYAEHEY